MISRLVIMMIKVNDSKSVIVEIDGHAYRIEDDSSYRDLLIFLTNPDPAVRFPDELFDVDPSVQEAELIEVGTRYSEFFKAYSRRRNARLDSKTSAIREGILTCEKAVSSLCKEDEESAG